MRSPTSTKIGSTLCPPATAATIRAIGNQFDLGGTESLENPQIFQTPEVKAAPGLAASKATGERNDLLKETTVRMFAA
jgi:type I restriction enzyme R subunit